MLLLHLSIEMILDDGGSNHFYKVITATRKRNPNTSIEVLTPDFLRKGEMLLRKF